MIIGERTLMMYIYLDVCLLASWFYPQQNCNIPHSFSILYSKNIDSFYILLFRQNKLPKSSKLLSPLQATGYYGV